jgi:hypothetical protein
MSGNLSGRSEHRSSAWRGRWQSLREINRVNLIMPLMFLLLICLLVGIWFGLPASKTAGEPSLEGFEEALDMAIDKNKSDFNLWYRSNVVIQCTLIFSALLATVFASLTTRENAEKVKKWSVLLTALTATLASAQSTFHIRENIETFIRSNGQLSLLEMDYLLERAPLDADLRKYKKSGADMDPDLEAKLTEIRHKYMPKYIDIQEGQMRAWANAGQPSAPLESGKRAPRNLDEK